MDHRLLTGLVSSLFSSLESGSPAGDSVTAPKLRFSLVCKGKLSETRESGAKGSGVALLFVSTSEAPFAQMPGVTERIPNVRTVTPKTSGDCLTFSFVFLVLDQREQ